MSAFHPSPTSLNNKHSPNAPPSQIFHLNLTPTHPSLQKFASPSSHSHASPLHPALARLTFAASSVDDPNGALAPSPTISVMPSSPLSPELDSFRGSFANGGGGGGGSPQSKRRSEASIQIFYSGAPVGLGLGLGALAHGAAARASDTKEAERAQGHASDEQEDDLSTPTALDSTQTERRLVSALVCIEEEERGTPARGTGAPRRSEVAEKEWFDNSRLSESTVRTSFSHSSDTPILVKTPTQRRPRTLEEEYRAFSRDKRQPPPSAASTQQHAHPDMVRAQSAHSLKLTNTSPRSRTATSADSPRKIRPHLHGELVESPSSWTSYPVELPPSRSAPGYAALRGADQSLDLARGTTVLYLQIDQEGFREVLVPVTLRAERGETLEFVASGACHPFHSSALQGNPVLRRVFVGESERDYLRRHASLSLREKEGLYRCAGGGSSSAAVGERWSFVYEVLERKSIAQKKLKGERLLRPVAFTCDKGFIDPTRGKKVSLAQMAIKSLQPGLTSTLVRIPTAGSE